MDESVKLAFEFARDLATQLITLSTGVLALSITFNKDVLKTAPRGCFSRSLLAISWLIFLGSILCGIWATMALTGSLTSFNKDHPMRSNVYIAASWQIGTFVLATFLLIWYGGIALYQDAKATQLPSGIVSSAAASPTSALSGVTEPVYVMAGEEVPLAANPNRAKVEPAPKKMGSEQ